MSANRKQKEPQGFRPIYVVVILAIFGLMYAIGTAIPQAPRNPRAAEVRQAARPVLDVVRSYRALHAGRAPFDLAELLTQLGDSALPLDPWGRALTYHHSNAKHESTYLLSLGADGAQGGSGEDQDVVVGVGD